MAPLMVTISTQRLADLEERIVALDVALADHASRYGMTLEARRLLVMNLHTPFVVLQGLKTPRARRREPSP